MVEKVQKLLQLWHQYQEGSPFDMGRFIAGLLLWIGLSAFFLYLLTFIFDEIESKYVYGIGGASIAFTLALVIFGEAQYWTKLKKEGITQTSRGGIELFPDPTSFAHGFMSAYSIYAEAFKGRAEYIGKGVKDGIIYNVYVVNHVAFVIPYSTYTSMEVEKVRRTIQDFIVNASLRKDLITFCKEFFEDFR